MIPKNPSSMLGFFIETFGFSVLFHSASIGFAMYNLRLNAGIAQLVERNLAKVEVASSSLVSRSIFKEPPCSFGQTNPDFCWIEFFGAIAKRLCNGLQIRGAQFDSGSRLQTKNLNGLGS